MFDASEQDAQVEDADTEDAESGDAQIEDGGGQDAGEQDAALDVGRPDVGRPDTGGSGTTPVRGDFIISEVQGNPVRVDDEQAEYIELWNVSGRTLDLSGVQIAFVTFPAGEPTESTAFHTISADSFFGAEEYVLISRGTGGFFGGTIPVDSQEEFVFSNAFSNRIRFMVPSWDGTEPPDPRDIIDEVIFEPGVFDNPVRGRALQLNPIEPPTYENNDHPEAWCHAPENLALEYRGQNWGTPGAENECR